MKKLIIAAIIIVLAITTGLGVWYLDRANKNRAAITAQEFTNHLRTGDFNKAYGLTSQEFRNQVTNSSEFGGELKPLLQGASKFTKTTPKVTSAAFSKSTIKLEGEITFTFGGYCTWIVWVSPDYDDGKFHFFHAWRVNRFDSSQLIGGLCK